MTIRPWQNKQLVGLSVKSMPELKRAIKLGVSMVEIKLEKFAQNGTPLYTMDEKGSFLINAENVLAIVELKEKYGIEVQFHLPLERSVNIHVETGINVGFLEYHEIALKRFKFLEEIYRIFGIGGVITSHLPTYLYNGLQFLEEDEAVENTRIFCERLDEMRIREEHVTLIGFENQPDPKFSAALLGNKAEHFKKILRNTRTLGLTIDTGHRLLSKNHTVRNLIELGFMVVNFHFHGNAGDFVYENYEDDEHLLPEYDNVKGYKNFLRYFRRHRTSVVLEIANLKDYTDDQLKSFIDNLKNQIV